MPFLYEKIDTLREVGVLKELPQYIPDNLNPNFELRPYQTAAFENFITYFENDKLCQKTTQTLFHMATGSGKTLIMAGLMLYLYKKGYRNFLFFVNLDNIVKKTEENFLNSASQKYLFADEIKIDGERVLVQKVSNFQSVDTDSINICFTTIQSLHSDLWNVKENSLSIDDFQDKKIVLISDEAHHLNADTKKGKKGSDDDNEKSWEYTVNRIWDANKDNVLLEFTATCNIENSYILSEYENKIIFDYPLKKFREEGYSKEVKAIRSEWQMDLSTEDWFVFNDNFGTTEEKSFVTHFAQYVERFKEKYDKVFLVRNERQLVLYSFKGGERFEPDYLLFLLKNHSDGFEQFQLFVEPKGGHLIAQDKWKEDFLLQIEAMGIPTKTFVDYCKYHVLGLPFYNQNLRIKEFDSELEKML